MAENGFTKFLMRVGELPIKVWIAESVCIVAQRV